ncbi:uncharacterized protein BXZ73DRAFT_105479 [Epithele typhae]|uniref:uncharacterized protein n=1 Tax=Epithele typhae TaxID=378194 RepID=UPI0020087D42|nr:uncharacterized protein BXZ73DRAFT_105479 [Epithele typhae]KAH9917656.1 hypothetical protein BXZ73DRAFT_105479 [Epithele typhae]
MSKTRFFVYYLDADDFQTVLVVADDTLEAIVEALNKKNKDWNIDPTEAKFIVASLATSKSLRDRVISYIEVGQGCEELSYTNYLPPLGIPHRDGSVDIILRFAPGTSFHSSILRSCAEIPQQDVLAPLPAMVKKDLDGIHRRLSKSKPPSASSQKDFVVERVTEEVDLVYGRPHETYGPSIAFFDPSIARLKQDIHTPTTTREERIELFPICDGFVKVASEFYPSEAERLSAVVPWIETLFPGHVVTLEPPTKAEKYHANIRWYFPSIDGPLLPYAVLELKNERGGRGDARFQALNYYRTSLKAADHEYHKHTNFPALILTLTANVLFIEAALFTDTIYCEFLSVLNLSLPFEAVEFSYHVVDVMAAVRRCLNSLRAGYRNVLADRPPVPSLNHFFPQPTALVDTEDSKAKPRALPEGLEFICRLDHLGAPVRGLKLKPSTRRCNPIYLAKLHGKVVLVKFTERYNIKAHEMLIDPGLAPPVHHFARIVGGYVIVMEYVPPELGHDLNDGKPNGTREEVARALGILHDAGIVFGDLREQNVLHIPATDNGDPARTWLIDFDWAGEAGVTEYPPRMNPGVAWAAGMVPGAPMKIECDNEMLEILFS